MANLAIFLHPDRIGVARMKSAGANPSFEPPVWCPVEDPMALIREPAMLTSLVRSLIADENKYDVYLTLWPGAYRSIVFSYGKKNKKDMGRLRKSELETVFHGEYDRLCTYDLVLDKGRASFGDKSRRVIYVTDKQTVELMIAAFGAAQMKLKRIAPMDVAAAEAAKKYWAPKDKEIHVAMMLDDACTSMAFFRDGEIQAIRSFPDGFGMVLHNYMTISDQDAETSRREIRENGVHMEDEDFDMPVIQDDALRTVNKLAVEVARTLHTNFGDDAQLGKVLLCGRFARTNGLTEYFNTRLETECTIVGTDTMSAAAVKAAALNEDDFEDLFPLVTTADKGADLLYQYKKEKSDKVTGAVVCGGMAVALAAIMAITPITRSGLEKELAATSTILEQEEYMTVRQLLDEKNATSRKLSALEAAIAGLPHGGTNTAGIITDLQTITNKYGTMSSISVDYTGGTISLDMTTMSYDSFIYWQQEITADGRFEFLEPPSFSGNGLVYSVSAKLTATDFDAQEG